MLKGYSGFVSLGNKITQMAKWGPGLEISFEWFHIYYNTYNWLVVAWKNNDPDLNGAVGFPGIWLRRNEIASYFPLESRKQRSHYQTVSVNKWHTYSRGKQNPDFSFRHFCA